MTYYPQQTLFYKIRDTLQSVAIFSGIGYLIYLFYKVKNIYILCGEISFIVVFFLKKFIRPWLFGRDKKKSIEDSIKDLNKSVTDSINEIRDNLTDVKTQVDRLSIRHSENLSMNSQLQELKNEISTVKGLLLNR